VAAASGVEMNVPWRAMRTGSVTMMRTLRKMPLPEYQRLLGIWLAAWTAITLGVTPSVCTMPVRS
jgi:hypothetical protein